SEKSHQATIALMKYDLSKSRKDHMNLEVSRANLEISFSSSRDRARRKLAYQQFFLEINARNLEKGSIHKAHASAQSIVNGILLRNSLPAVNIPPLNVSKDEEYPEPDIDYEFVSYDEKDQEDLRENNKSTNGINAEIENPEPNTNA
ncbi:hypothetical protein MKX03_013384, partial [Papaver bracteatum]